MNAFNWERRGLLVEPGFGTAGFSHASHPVVVPRGEGNYLLIFSMRDQNKQSHLFSSSISVTQGKIELVNSATLRLSPGEKGTFDSEGLLGCCAVSTDNGELLYYTGWNNLGDGSWLCDTGLATVSPETGEIARKFAGPVMSRGVANPLFAAGTSVIMESGKFRSWYNRGISWVINPQGQSVARYGIFYAESEDGIDWQYSGQQSIQFLDEQEHSFGRPCVVRLESGYHMWFGHRGSESNPLYRLGYAESADGITWSRNDKQAGIEPSGRVGDFDCNAVTYPYAFRHRESLFMVYNGDGYGATGIGYAVTKL